MHKWLTVVSSKVHLDSVDRASGDAGTTAIAGCIINANFKPPPERGQSHDRFLAAAFDAADAAGSIHRQAVAADRGTVNPWVPAIRQRSFVGPVKSAARAGCTALTTKGAFALREIDQGQASFQAQNMLWACIDTVTATVTDFDKQGFRQRPGRAQFRLVAAPVST